MMVRSRVSGFTLCILLWCFGLSSFFHTQTSAIADQDETLATRPLENVRIEAQGIGRLLSELSLSYNMPLGLEIALKDDEAATYQIDFKKGTLSDLLTQFVAQHDQYSWEIKDGVINVFPKDSDRDPLFGELLETKIRSFSVKQETNCWTLAQSLVATPEIKEVLEMKGATYRSRGFSGSYIPQLGRNFRLDVSNMTLKSILNKVAKESPTAKFWLLTRNSNDQTLSISFNARQEDSP